MRTVLIVLLVSILALSACAGIVQKQLDKSREKSYRQDKQLVQTAVDSFFTAADNQRYLGARQFPVLAASDTGNGTLVSAFDSGTNVVPPSNPVRGTRSGDPEWRDGANGDGRKLGDDGGLLAPGATASEENLNDIVHSMSEDNPGWTLDQVTFQGDRYGVDSRGYFIDFDLLVKDGFLQSAPHSASLDNKGGTTKGSYSWYVKRNGEVESLLFYQPVNGVVPTGGLDNRGCIEGVYP